MDCVVLVPRRPEPWRDKLWGYVRAAVVDGLDRPVIVEGRSLEGPFNRSRALNEAARVAGVWDVAVILDADTVPDFDRLLDAVDLAAETGKLVCPQDVFRSLTREGTKAVLAGGCAIAEAPKRWDYPRPKSSCIVLSRALWEQTGGFDERFEGWGFEDASFYHACEALAGVERLEGPVWHCWHPRSGEKDPASEAYRANEALGARYKAARHDPDAMREILSEPGGPLALHRGGPVSHGGIPVLNCGCVR